MGTSGNRKMVFKRFTVRDEKCAMKIGTDGVMIGAWASPNHNHKKTQFQIADIGSGSGVIALMLAQRFPESFITAVELEPQAAEQSQENFNASPFHSRLECIEESFQEWSLRVANDSRYDLVVSNPPFFHGKPKSPFHARNLARHDDYLNVTDLFDGANKVLSREGVFCVVWPVERDLDLMEAASHINFKMIRKCLIRPTPNHESVRFMAEFSKMQPGETSTVNVNPTVFTLETGEGEGRDFTPEYDELMKAFFLDK